MNTRTIEVTDVMTVEQFISELAGLTYGSGDPETVSYTHLTLPTKRIV